MTRKRGNTDIANGGHLVNPDAIAKHIHADIAGMKKSSEEWNAHVYNLCIHVSDARALYPKDKDFGAWWDAQEFGLNHQDRAALVAMGKDLQRAHDILEKTERRSIRHIHANEFRFTHVGKPQESDKPKQKKRGRPAKEKPEAIVIAEVINGGQEPTNEELAERFNLKPRAARDLARVVTAGVESAKAAVPDIDPTTLSLTAQQKLEICERKLRRDIEAEFDERVRVEVERILKEQFEPEIMKSIEFCRKWGKSYVRSRLPLSQDEFKKILVCLHPDRVQDDVMKRRFSQAFDLFKSKEAQLVAPDAPMVSDGFAFPTNMAEFLRRRKVK